MIVDELHNGCAASSRIDTNEKSQVPPAVAVHATSLLEEINRYRASVSLGPLVGDDCLDSKIQAHCERMEQIGRLTHQGLMARIRACNKRGGGENVAWGYLTPAECVALWADSPGHAKNMRGPWSVCGTGSVIGYYGGTYYGALFA